MMLGFLLARAGVDVVVLEKHGDFLRDFRGDTIHPSTLELMHELGLLDDFLARPHQEAERITGVVGDEEVVVADFSHLPTRCKFVGLMPQWDFLDFLKEQAGRYPTFHLRMRAEVVGLIEENGRVVGVRAHDARRAAGGPRRAGRRGRRPALHGPRAVRAEGPGHRGTDRRACGCGCPARPSDPVNLFGRFASGKVFVMLDRGDYWQCAYVHPQGRHRRGPAHAAWKPSANPSWRSPRSCATASAS